ncbi:MAG: DNA primase [Candidatus Omnitrophica bacterium]|nr:DNA primase [Candidatus Omnitrophota bacterium]
MSQRIPENILDDILSRIDIVEVIGSFIPLKRAGRTFKACCPFHHEKTASFMVSPDRQIFHCFGCGKGGNAFKFLMEYERLEFPEAVEVLAKKAGVLLPEARREDQQTVSISTQLYKINELATRFYAQSLKSAQGTKVRAYLTQRGITNESIEAGMLGYAPDAWDALLTHLRAKGVSIALLERAGLVIAKDSGGYYDRFRNRLIFPIVDVRARPIAFGARVLDNSLPKYINSPETTIYTKGKNVYGLNLAKDAIREQDSVVIVEGYLDFLIPYQAGLRNIIASQGTALTSDAIRLLKRYTHNAVMVYDADNAGQLATVRTLELFIEEGMDVSAVSLPEGYDPDTFVRKFGIEAFKEKIAEAQSLFDFKLRLTRARHSLQSAEGKAKIAAEMLATIHKCTNAVVRSEYVRKLAEDLNVQEGPLLEELKKIKEPKTLAERMPSRSFDVRQAKLTEKLLIKLMLEEKECVRHICASLEPADFQDARIAKIVSTIFDLLQQGKDIETSKVMNYIDGDDAAQLICESTLLPEVPEQDKDKVIADCIQRLKHDRLKLKRAHLHEQIKHAQDAGDEELLQRLTQEFHSLMKAKV